MILAFFAFAGFGLVSLWAHIGLQSSTSTCIWKVGKEEGKYNFLLFLTSELHPCPTPEHLYGVYHFVLSFCIRPGAMEMYYWANSFSSLIFYI